MITIYSPGEYASNHKPEDYMKGNYESVIRNATISKILYLNKSIEQFGSGFKRINSLCKDAGMPIFSTKYISISTSTAIGIMDNGYYTQSYGITVGLAKLSSVGSGYGSLGLFELYSEKTKLLTQKDFEKRNA